MSNKNEVLAKALNDKKLMKHTASIMKKMIDGEPVNKNPLTKIPKYDMRLYGINDEYFESIDKLLYYCRVNKLSAKNLNILDYYKNFAGRSDVIRKSNSNTSMFYTAIDEDGYAMYNNKRSIYCGEFIWEYNYGSIRDMYNVFRDKGIIFENDIYAKEDERHQQILKMCREKHLFNYGKK